MPQETYSLLSLDEDADDDRHAGTRYAPWENMLSAAHQVVSLLAPPPAPAAQPVEVPAPTNDSLVESPAKNYAMLGGFSMQLRGGRRSTRDIDLVTSVTMRGVWQAITGVDRIVIPDSRLVEGVVKVFVWTGAPWDACAEAHRIEVDIAQAGFRGSPRRLDENVEVVGPFDLFGRALYFNVLAIASMMRIKVECCLSREEPRDFEDVRYMIASYTAQVRAALEVGVVEEEDLVEVLQHEKMGAGSVCKNLANLLSLEDQDRRS